MTSRLQRDLTAYDAYTRAGGTLDLDDFLDVCDRSASEGLVEDLAPDVAERDLRYW
jgi:hypothetical protein